MFVNVNIQNSDGGTVEVENVGEVGSMFIGGKSLDRQFHARNFVQKCVILVKPT